MKLIIPPQPGVAPKIPDTVLTRRSDKRQQALVQAAFDIIAERGLEGLRTRAVAERARVNIATLHYYFAGKEALVGGVVGYMVEQFRMFNAPPVYEGEPCVLDRLRQEFADSQYYQEKHPKLIIVYEELFLRSQRDPSIQPMIRYLEDYWYGDVQRILIAGVHEGVFRPDLDIDIATNMILALLRGAVITTLMKFDFDRAFKETEIWLSNPRPHTGRQDGVGS